MTYSAASHQGELYSLGFTLDMQFCVHVYTGYSLDNRGFALCFCLISICSIFVLHTGHRIKIISVPDIQHFWLTLLFDSLHKRVHVSLRMIRTDWSAQVRNTKSHLICTESEVELKTRALLKTFKNSLCLLATQVTDVHITNSPQLPSHSNRIASFLFFLYSCLLFITMGHIGGTSPKMQIHIQFHGSESTQNSLSPAMEKHMEVQNCDRLDKMIHAAPNSLGCQALLAFSMSSSFTPHNTPKEY